MNIVVDMNIVVEKPGSAVLQRFSAPVGGPLATMRAEAVGLLYLMRKVNTHSYRAIPLLVLQDDIHCANPPHSG